MMEASLVVVELFQETFAAFLTDMNLRQALVGFPLGAGNDFLACCSVEVRPVLVRDEGIETFGRLRLYIWVALAKCCEDSAYCFVRHLVKTFEEVGQHSLVLRSVEAPEKDE